MIEQILEKLNQQEEIRESLIQLRAEIKDENQKERLLENDSFDPIILMDFLSDEDPKVRKNAALILGELEIEQSVNAIFHASFAPRSAKTKTGKIREYLDLTSLRVHFNFPLCQVYGVPLSCERVL